MTQGPSFTEFSSLRQQTGLSVAEAAARTGYGERTVYRWETGETKPRKAVLEFLRTLKTSDELQPKPSSFTFIDLFAGIGGLRKGFEPIGGKCVFTCEWDRYSQKTYRANFPNDEHEISGDIREVIKAGIIPSHDVLLAGFPCQPFSIAGVSKKNALNRPHGFACEAQGTLFHDVARIIHSHQPKAFVLENVKNLVNHDKGRTFGIIEKVLKKDLGYQIHCKVIDAKSFVPQHRERIFIVGFREANSFTFEGMDLPDPMVGPKLRTILHNTGGKPEKAYTGRDGRAADKYTLSDHLWGYLKEYAEKHRLKGNGFGFGLFGPDDVARTLSARYHKDGSEILIRQDRGAPRRLTPRECARLMGFDSEGKPPVRIPVSDTQAYRQFGNSVVVPVVEAVARHMRHYIVEAVSNMESETRTKAVA
jgi:DNA (cytosine-5)-methyltransferase 1